MNDQLTTSLTAAWTRATAVSLARELPYSFLDLLLPLTPEVTPEVFLLLQHRRSGLEQAFHSHASLFWERAEDLLVDRLPSMEDIDGHEATLVLAARTAPRERLPIVREFALARLALAQPAPRRIEALCRLRAVLPERAAAMEEEALGLFPGLSADALNGALVELGSEAVRARWSEVRALADARSDAPGAHNLLVTLARMAPSEESVELAERAFPGVIAAHDSWFFRSLHTLRELVPYAVARPWLVRAIPECENDYLDSFAAILAPGECDEVLDALLEYAEDADADAWQLIDLLTAAAPRHGSRRDELLMRLSGLVDAAVGDTVEYVTPETEDGIDDSSWYRAFAAITVSEVFEGESRVRLQRLALDLVASMQADDMDPMSLGNLPWETLGGVLHPSLREAAVDAALGIKRRDIALEALGELVGALPPECRQFALRGLARLADDSPPDELPLALGALTRARTTSPRRPARAPAFPPGTWTADDERALRRVSEALATEALPGRALRTACRTLTAAAAQKALEQVHADRHVCDRANTLLFLAAAPALAHTAVRHAIVAVALEATARQLIVELRSPKALGAAVSAVCDEAPIMWGELVARFFERIRLGAGEYLEFVAALAPAIACLGGETTVDALMARLRAPWPVPEFARPWAQAAAGCFEA